ncbi:MAG: nuclear transport factor 2 family protein [Acidimicrobiia bacterium]|nr:nuclear transport factor 2 family protein [Acidimicrobiia bacterium]
MDELERLLAERACERLIVDYCRFVDFGEASRIAELFTENGTWESDEVVMSGRADIRARFLERQGVTRRVSRHLCTNVGIDVLSADEAEGLCYLVNYRHDRQEGDSDAVVPAELPKFVGEYHDRFRRTAEGWRFERRRVDLAFVRPTRASAPLE